MNNSAEFWQKPCQKTFINVSICKSNIKEETYYARPWSAGRVKSDELLARLKRVIPYVDEAIMSIALQELSNLMVTLIAEGKTVEFFSLGSFSLGVRGAVEVERNKQSYLQDESRNVATCQAKTMEDMTLGSYNLDVSHFIKKKPTFSLKFEQSPLVKKALQNMEVNVSVKKKRSPTIAQIVNVVPTSLRSANSELPTILRIKGDDLKVVSQMKDVEPARYDASKNLIKEDDERGAPREAGSSVAEQVGIYIEESGSGHMHKLPMENILKNTPRELLILLDERLEDGKKYELTIATQYVKMGERRVGTLLRVSKVAFGSSEMQVERSAVVLNRALVSLKKSRDCPVEACLKRQNRRTSVFLKNYPLSSKTTRVQHSTQAFTLG